MCSRSVFDRLLVALAVQAGLLLLTTDRTLVGYGTAVRLGGDELRQACRPAQTTASDQSPRVSHSVAGFRTCSRV